MTKPHDSSSCPEMDRMERHVRGALTPAENALVLDHIAVCEQCANLAAQLRENEKVLGTLRTAIKADSFDAAHPAGVQTIEQAQNILGERYRVTRKVGSGSAGQVYQAVDTVLDRLGAVKFPRQSAQGEPWQEARLASRINHPNIAQIFEIGQKETQRFIVMEWVEGGTITDCWRGLPLEQRLGLFLGVLEAVAAAHRQGIVHRDLKPSNILIAAGGRPKVLDFGIAHEWSAGGVEEAVFRGTPAYSAPEQVTVPVQISPATDVFALGVILYELLTDSLPFAQKDMKQLFDAIRNEHPELPNAIQEKVPIALQNICLKALEKDPAKRYADAQGLHDDVSRYLRGERVWSRPSFLNDKIQQEVSYHRQRLAVWHQNELITQKEYDKLEGIYEAMVSPSDPSIIEARELSVSQVCLYLGGWLAVLGSFVLFYKTWDQIPLYWRPAPAIAASLLMAVFGVFMWQRKESRLSVGILSTANLLIPITILLTLGQWHVLSAAAYPWGTETVFNHLTRMKSHVVVGNVQLYLASAAWLVCSLVFLRVTRSSIFVVFSIAAFLAWLTTCYVIGGMEKWSGDVTAGRYLYPAAGLFIAGVVLDRRGFSQYAWPPAVVGTGLLIASLSGIALSDTTLFGWVWKQPQLITDDEARLLSLICNGILYLSLAGLCMRLGTRLQRWLGQALNWLGPLHILAMLRLLDSNAMTVHPGHELVYRFALPVASLVFVFGSVARQMKSFFFSGLAGIAVSVHKITVEHLDKFFGWPVSLIATGIVWMAVSWLVPRWKAKCAIRKASKEVIFPCFQKRA
jgi:serine/threonine protein kinase